MKRLQGAIMIFLALLVSSCGRAVETLQHAETQPRPLGAASPMASGGSHVTPRTSPSPEGGARPDRLEVATLGAGCFWCVEAVFEELKGVRTVVSGYSGGHVADPTYEDVCSGKTGHAEVINVTFDPTVISFKQVLEVFFSVHDPTTLNRQGADVGTQYRSAIFYHDERQREVAEDVIREETASGDWPRPVVTQVAPFTAFYEAEKYHQGYYRANPYQSYCHMVITPKMKKFRQRFEALLENP